MTRKDLRYNQAYRYTKNGWEKNYIWKLCRDDDSTFPFFINEHGSSCYIHLDHLKPVAPTLEDVRTLCQGNVLIADDYEERIIQGTIGEIVFYIYEDGVSGLKSIQELKNDRWHLKDTTPTETVEILGKKYNKQAVEQRLAELEGYD